jgi:nephrocystin-3
MNWLIGWFNTKHRSRSEPTRADAPRAAPEPASTPARSPPLATSRTILTQPAIHAPAAEQEDNRSVRVFVSSTFLDMQTERRLLATDAFPRLQSKYRARAVEVFEVDLRWGITPDQQDRGETLPTLFAEIDRCAYFMGLLGDRYGSVLGPEALTDKVKTDYPTVARGEGLSITAMEIMHGVLSKPDAAGRAVFFLRDKNWDWRSTLTAADRTKATPETDARRDKLDKLKEQIGKKARVDGYAKPEDIRQKAYEALDALLEARFPEREAPDAFEQTTRLHRAYARERRVLYVGGASYLHELDRWMETKGAAPKLVTGLSGGGKSTLIANWLHAWRGAHRNDIVFEHYLGASPDSTDPILLMRRLWEHLNPTAGEAVDLPDANAHLMNISVSLAQRLAQTRAIAERGGARLLIALDGLDKLSSEQDLRWLPLVPGVHVLASSLEGETKSAAIARGFVSLEVKPLSEKQPREFIEKTLDRWGRKLEPENMTRVLTPTASKLAGSPLYLRTVLDELRVSADSARLAQQLETYRTAADMSDLFRRVLARLKEDCEPGLVAKALPLIWASRAGLEEAEIIAITGATPLAWAKLRNGLGDALRDQVGRMAFGHDYLNKAVETSYLETDKAKRATHLSIADRFEKSDATARQIEEVPYQLRAAGKLGDDAAWTRLEAVLIDLKRFTLLRARGDSELLSYWLPLKERGRDPETLLCAAFEARAGKSDKWTEADLDLAFALTEFLDFAGAHGGARTRLQEDLAPASGRIFGPEHLSVARACYGLAQLYHSSFRLAEAEPLFMRAIAIWQSSLGPEHPNVARGLNNLALLYDATKRRAEAELLLKRALVIDENSFGPDHPNVAIRLSNLASIYHSTGRYTEAVPLAKRALAIDEKSFGPNHQNVANRLNILASLYGRTNRYTEAEPLLKRALAIVENIYGPVHTSVWSCVTNLALFKSATNRHDEAEQLFRRALAIAVKVYGPVHPSVAQGLHNLAQLYYGTNRPREAEMVLNHLHSIEERMVRGKR